MVEVVVASAVVLRVMASRVASGVGVVVPGAMTGGVATVAQVEAS